MFRNERRRRRFLKISLISWRVPVCTCTRIHRRVYLGGCWWERVRTGVSWQCQRDSTLQVWSFDRFAFPCDRPHGAVLSYLRSQLEWFLGVRRGPVSLHPLCERGLVALLRFKGTPILQGPFTLLASSACWSFDSGKIIEKNANWS